MDVALHLFERLCNDPLCSMQTAITSVMNCMTVQHYGRGTRAYFVPALRKELFRRGMHTRVELAEKACAVYADLKRDVMVHARGYALAGMVATRRSGPRRSLAGCVRKTLRPCTYQRERSMSIDTMRMISALEEQQAAEVASDILLPLSVRKKMVELSLQLYAHKKEREVAAHAVAEDIDNPAVGPEPVLIAWRSAVDCENNELISVTDATKTYGLQRRDIAHLPRVKENDTQKYGKLFRVHVMEVAARIHGSFERVNKIEQTIREADLARHVYVNLAAAAFADLENTLCLTSDHIFGTPLHPVVQQHRNNARETFEDVFPVEPSCMGTALHNDAALEMDLYRYLVRSTQEGGPDMETHPSSYKSWSFLLARTHNAQHYGPRFTAARFMREWVEPRADAFVQKVTSAGLIALTRCLSERANVSHIWRWRGRNTVTGKNKDIVGVRRAVCRYLLRPPPHATRDAQHDDDEQQLDMLCAFLNDNHSDESNTNKRPRLSRADPDASLHIDEPDPIAQHDRDTALWQQQQQVLSPPPGSAEQIMDDELDRDIASMLV